MGKLCVNFESTMLRVSSCPGGSERVTDRHCALQQEIQLRNTARYHAPFMTLEVSAPAGGQ